LLVFITPAMQNTPDIFECLDSSHNDNMKHTWPMCHASVGSPM